METPASSERKQASLLESVGEILLLLVLVAVIVIVPLLVCDWLACVALPMPAEGAPETRQVVAARRESLTKVLFGLVWAGLGGWLIFAG